MIIKKEKQNTMNQILDRLDLKVLKDEVIKISEEIFKI